MDNFHHRQQLLLAGNLAALIGCIVLLTHFYLRSGISATWLLLLLVTLSLTSYLFTLFKRQHKQLTQVIKALANGDNTLGLSAHHPMRQHFENVKQQMQAARFDAQQQAQFLQALLVHVDLAVLVCDAKGRIIESNPAATRLLGKAARHLDQLGQIGTMIVSADNNLRSTAHWLRGEQQDTLSIQVSVAEIQGQVRKVITLQSIHEELINKEQQAYKRLTRVLTHEVANTITPLTSIAQTCQGLVPEKMSFDDEESKADLSLALKTLTSRARYLGEFIERFRQVSSLPMPNLSPTSLAPLLERIGLLHQPQLTQHNIVLDIDIQNHQLVMLDSAQVEQVLINLVKNAIESLHSLATQQQLSNTQGDGWQGKITLALGQNSAQQLYVEVADNGPGIEEHVAEMIFVPFFTTKQQGSGIGLSLSRQIMVNHGGDLVYLNRSQGACFRCVFG